VYRPVDRDIFARKEMITRVHTHSNRPAGFTLIESVATLAVVSVLMVGLAGVANSVLNRRQVDMTTDQMNEIRRAMTGNPVIIVNEARTAFGYLGDMGNFPANIQDLWVKGSQPEFVFNTAKKTGAGWHGPYLELRAIEYATALGTDGWGNNFSYSTTPAVDPTFGATVFAQFLSLGPDRTAGGNDDITINFFKAETQSRLQGYVKDNNGDVVPGVNVTVNYPQNGVLTTASTVADDTGYYAINDIPYGNRSVTIDPKLVLAPGTTAVSGNNNQNVVFTVKNFSALDVAIASVTVTYNITPPAYFATLRLGNTTVYSSTSVRIASGNTKTVSPAISVTGTGSVQESIPIRIQSAVTDVSDLIIGDIGRGGSLAVEMNGFSSAANNSGTDVDITGVNFEVTFKDSGNNIIGVVAVTPSL
jgi:prepilin-type N-terminal cleavage/methylation domain-containing protein